jgi:hypothetical protein
MDDIIKNIIDYAQTIDDSLPQDNSDNYLSLIANMVVDKALAYTNRTQLVEDYEDVKTRYADNLDEYQKYDGSIVGYECPIPPQLERALGLVVTRVYKNAREDDREVKSASDQGQSVTYGEQAVNYLYSADDGEVFSGIKSTLDKFRIPTVSAIT